MEVFMFCSRPYKTQYGQIWWYMPAVLTLQGLMQEDRKFKVRWAIQEDLISKNKIIKATESTLYVTILLVCLHDLRQGLAM